MQNNVGTGVLDCPFKKSADFSALFVIYIIYCLFLKSVFSVADKGNYNRGHTEHLADYTA